MIQSRWADRLLWRIKDMELQARVYDLLALSGGGLMILVAVPLNLFARSNLAAQGVLLLYGAVNLALYAAARRGRRYPLLFVGLLLLALNIEFFVDGGSASSVPMWFFAAPGMVVLLLEGRQRLVLLSLILVNSVALFLAESAFPALVVPFASGVDRLAYLLSGLIVSVIGCVLLFWVVTDSYVREHEKLRQVRDRLEQSTRKITELRALLPICPSCHKVRDDRGHWLAVERYLETSDRVLVSHGLCQECRMKYFPDR